MDHFRVPRRGKQNPAKECVLLIFLNAFEGLLCIKETCSDTTLCCSLQTNFPRKQHAESATTLNR